MYSAIFHCFACGVEGHDYDFLHEWALFPSPGSLEFLIVLKDAPPPLVYGLLGTKRISVERELNAYENRGRAYHIDQSGYLLIYSFQILTFCEVVSALL